MRLPKRKGNPKLPPVPRGGGAAARQKQFELERGMDPPAPLASGRKGDRTSCEEDKDKEDKNK